ncbi:hypothetical protein Tco_1537351 [Tanacetum coccineum]
MNLKVNIVIWEYYVNGMLFFLIINLYVPFGIPFNPKRYYKDGSYTNVTEAKEYTEEIRHSYEQRLETIWSRPVNQVHVLDFKGLTLEMRHDLAVRLRMVYSGEGQQVMSDTEMGLDVTNTFCFQLGGVRRRMTWR